MLGACRIVSVMYSSDSSKMYMPMCLYPRDVSCVQGTAAQCSSVCADELFGQSSSENCSVSSRLLCFSM